MKSITEIQNKIDEIGVVKPEQIATYEEGFLDALMWVLGGVSDDDVCDYGYIKKQCDLDCSYECPFMGSRDI